MGNVKWNYQKSEILKNELEDHKKSIEKEFNDEVEKEVNQRIRKFFTGRFHHQKSVIQHPLAFMINHLNIKNIEDLKGFICSERGQNMLKKNISRAEKAYSFTEDLYKFYSKEVTAIEYSVNKLAVEIQDSIRKFQSDNSDLMFGIRIDFSGFWPIYDEESENTEIELIPHVKIDTEFFDFTFLGTLQGFFGEK